jgi:hypothetical protein
LAGRPAAQGAIPEDSARIGRGDLANANGCGRPSPGQVLRQGRANSLRCGIRQEGGAWDRVCDDADNRAAKER